MILLTGTLTTCLGIRRFHLWSGETATSYEIILSCNAPAILKTIEYQFECNNVDNLYYANHLVAWRPAPVDPTNNNIAHVVYEQCSGMSNYFRNPPIPFDELIKIKIPPRATPQDVSAYVWQFFGSLSLIERLTGEFQLWSREVLLAMDDNRWYDAMRLGVTFRPEQIRIYTEDDDVCEDVFLYNHLKQCSHEFGWVLTREQVQASYPTRDNTTLDRLEQSGLVWHDVEGHRTALSENYARQVELDSWQREETDPLPIVAPTSLAPIVLESIQAWHITCVDTHLVEETTKLIEDTWGKDVVMVVNARCARFVDSPQRVVIIGQRDGVLSGTLLAWTTTWLIPTPRPNRPHRTLQTMTRKHAQAGQIVNLYEPRSDERMQQLREILETPWRRVLFVFTRSTNEMARYESGFAYKSPNLLVTRDVGVLKKNDVVRCVISTRKIKGGEKKTTHYVRGGKEVQIGPTEFLAMMPLHACRVELLPHLQPSDFECVVLFAKKGTRPCWVQEASRVGAKGVTLLYL